MEPNSQLHTISNCPVCGNMELSLYLKTRDYFLTQEEFSLDQCSSCGFIFTNPIPALSTLSKYYESPDYLSHTANSFSIKGEIYKLFRSLNIRKKFKLVNQLAKGKTILDIGCGTGELLSYFKKMGWDTMGIEPNPSARKFAKNTYQLEVFEEENLDKLKENSFDVISMWHVLEHVPDLQGRIEQVKNLLRKDGLLIIALPNIESPDAVKYGTHWAGLDVPRHLYHFAKDTVKVLLEAHNMELIESIPMKYDAYYVSLLSEQYLKKSLAFVPAFLNGLHSNRQARKDNNYSSMIFVVKLK